MEILSDYCCFLDFRPFRNCYYEFGCFKTCLINTSYLDKASDSVEDTVHIISAKQAYKHCADLMLWLEEHLLTKPDDLTSMQRIKELASKYLFDEMETGEVSSGDGAAEDTIVKEEVSASLNGEIDKLTTTFLDEENAGNVLGLKEECTVEKVVSKLSTS